MNQEEQIILRCQQGDREAMGLLYTAMHDELLAVCRRYVAADSAGSSATAGVTAEDLLHDAFLLIFSRIGSIHSPKAARAWMHKVVKNVALLYVRKQGQLPTVPIDEIGNITAQGNLCSREFAIPAPSPLPITYDELMNIIDALPEGYRRVFRLSVLDGLSHQEIAALLNIEPHSSSSQLHRAKSLLRQSLAVLLVTMVTMVGIREIFVAKKSASDKQKPIATSTVPRTDTDNTGQGTDTGIENPLEQGDADPTPVPTLQEERSENPLEQRDADPTPAPTLQEERSENPLEQGDADPTPAPALQREGIANPLEQSENPLEQRKYTLALSYSGLPSHSNQSLPTGIEGTNGPIDSTAHHRMPLTVGLDISCQLNARWALNAGLRYTLLTSDFETGNTLLHADRHQQVRYLGLSLGATYQIWPGRQAVREGRAGRDALRLYGSASLAFDLPLRSTVETTYVQTGIADPTPAPPLQWEGRAGGDAPPLQWEGRELLRLHPAGQWSVGLGVGVQYNLTPAVGLFAEPSLRYHFPTDDGISTWRSAHPVGFSLPIGIRISLSRK